MKLLVAAGSPIEARLQGWTEATALHLAAKNGHIDTVRLLLEKGADPNAKDKNESVIEQAATFHHADVADLIRSYIQREPTPKSP